MARLRQKIKLLVLKIKIKSFNIFHFIIQLNLLIDFKIKLVINYRLISKKIILIGINVYQEQILCLIECEANYTIY